MCAGGRSSRGTTAGVRRANFISFAFTDDACKEIKRFYKDGELEIVPITVKGLLDKSGHEVVRG
jgi:hypothetical protein